MVESNLENIAKNYAKMSDADIVRIATKEATGLRPEVFGIIENEIKKRNLNQDLFRGVLAQNKKYTVQEIEEYANLISELPCPICGSLDQKLNGTLSHTVKSMVFVTTSKTELTIACPDCLDKKNDQAIKTSALLGWWGIPWGIIKTPLAIFRNEKAKKQNRMEFLNTALMSFTIANIGQIETYKNDKQELLKIITPKKY